MPSKQVDISCPVPIPSVAAAVLVVDSYMEGVEEIEKVVAEVVISPRLSIARKRKRLACEYPFKLRESRFTA